MRRWDGELVELSVKRIGAAGTASRDGGASPSFSRSPCRATMSAPSSAPAAVGDWKPTSFSLWVQGPGVPRHPVATSGLAADVRCSTSMPISTGRSSSEGC
jgi:hypothetical protein